ncbi:10ae02ec-d6ed-4af7-8f78-fee0b52ce790 [Sclerotinia trifoliorum]|uniref:10ae02ec-d6ed-4af7-8f78-fee0b52ce790 n=1 Tax=Sclerotinia trifoliorum TaxID=28548 RepID=A0A8H2W4E7_9HELO|nr:10ae02ec-d6ed-4af7-8f78-fee0b52ce790 [Sclerotinia trifoliorum]
MTTITDAILLRIIKRSGNTLIRSVRLPMMILEDAGKTNLWELARHSIGEELVVYPAFAKHLGMQGQKMADNDRAEHQTVKEALYKFQNLKPSDADLIPTLDDL